MVNANYFCIFYHCPLVAANRMIEQENARRNNSRIGVQLTGTRRRTRVGRAAVNFSDCLELFCIELFT